MHFFLKKKKKKKRRANNRKVNIYLLSREKEVASDEVQAEKIQGNMHDITCGSYHNLFNGLAFLIIRHHLRA
jgi:gamma-glutamylcysteine synthetase